MLQVLCINDNYIESLSGLSTLTRLRELSAARNALSTLGPEVPCLSSLEILNVADNHIGSFKVWARLCVSVHMWHAHGASYAHVMRVLADSNDVCWCRCVGRSLPP